MAVACLHTVTDMGIDRMPITASASLSFDHKPGGNDGERQPIIPLGLDKFGPLNTKRRFQYTALWSTKMVFLFFQQYRSTSDV